MSLPKVTLPLPQEVIPPVVPRSVGRPVVPRQVYRSLDALCGGDPLMHEVITRGKRLIDKGIPILILGETGTGKEYLARALHDYSVHRNGNWVAVNCASIPESLAESELFGYCKGAFSGALPGGMKGKVQQADGGTLFLDEIGDMPFTLQTRLLRVLSEREVLPLGAQHPVPVDLHLLCATHQDLQVLVAQGRFREDLYYRIAGGVLRLPPLRARSDLQQLILHMIADELTPHRSVTDILSSAVWQRMLDYAWPGNLRQLHAVVRYCCAVMNGDCIVLSDLPEDLMQATTMPMPPLSTHLTPTLRPVVLDQRRDDERARVIEALIGSRWNISAASRQLGMCRASLYRKLQRLGIPHVRDQVLPTVVA